jgi:hypothetical protein
VFAPIGSGKRKSCITKARIVPAFWLVTGANSLLVLHLLVARYLQESGLAWGKLVSGKALLPIKRRSLAQSPDLVTA